MGLFRTFLEQKKAPIQWKGKASPSIKQEFNEKIEAAFPELRLCHSHWKAELVAIRTYPAFKSQYSNLIESQLSSHSQNMLISSAQKRSLSLAIEGPVTNTKCPRKGPREAYQHPL